MNRGQRRQAWLHRHRSQIARSSPGIPPPPNVEVHVAELVLHGFAAGDRDAIGTALQVEVTRLIGEQGVPRALLAQGNVADRLDAGGITLATDARPQAVGTQLARAVFQAGGAAR